MEARPPQPLDYQPRPPRAPLVLHSGTRWAITFIILAWFSSIILLSGIWRFTASANVIGGGLALLGLLRPQAQRGERIVLIVLLALAVAGLLL